MKNYLNHSRHIVHREKAHRLDFIPMCVQKDTVAFERLQWYNTDRCFK